MEEIITVDGKQFKLSTDRPLTAIEKAQTIDQIRKQTGCGTCGKPGVASMGNDWQYGGVMPLAGPATCTKTTASSTIGDVVTLAATPNLGTAPYTVKFLGQFGAGPVALVAGTAPYGLSGTNPQSGLIDGQTTSGVTYQITDAQIVASAGGPPIAGNVDGSGIGVPVGAANTVRFLVHTSDSCPTGPLHCLDYCDLGIVCVAPTCSFVVT